MCDVICPHTGGVLTLDCRPGRPMLDMFCNDHHTKIYDNYKYRLHLNTSSGCWVLRDARKEDSGVYEIRFHSSAEKLLKSTQISVIDPVVIYNITSNSSLLGSDVSLHVLFSGEETTVTWEVDGGALPGRYQLSDRKRTLLIPSAQRGDDGRRFSVGVTNPVSEDSREYVLQLIDNGSSNQLSAGAVAGVVVGILVIIGIVAFLIILMCTKMFNQREASGEERNRTSGHGGEVTNRSPETAGETQTLRDTDSVKIDSGEVVR
ncbi:cell adhesion molecule CEACAM1-like isoform X1 [Ascaphus truei]|uniref:cell adhesion molecule CEACAM1-like isoform X1 n=1 Tax=Ascaphus truei TaxID=8439 RepID=UPI003F59D589